MNVNLQNFHFLLKNIYSLDEGCVKSKLALENPCQRISNFANFHPAKAQCIAKPQPTGE